MLAMTSWMKEELPVLVSNSILGQLMLFVIDIKIDDHPLRGITEEPASPILGAMMALKMLQHQGARFGDDGRRETGDRHMSRKGKQVVPFYTFLNK
jgi:hypothetical protein